MTDVDEPRLRFGMVFSVNLFAGSKSMMSSIIPTIEVETKVSTQS